MAFAWNLFKLFHRISPELARKRRLEALLARIAADPAADDHVSIWVTLINTVRPSRAHRADDAIAALSELTQMLAEAPDSRHALRAALLKLFINHKQTSLYVSSGLLPSTGFFTETARRISHRLLPDVVSPAYLKDLLTVIFHRKNDEIWVKAIPDETWIGFFRTLLDDGETAPHNGKAPPIALTEVLESLRILSYHISAIGLDPELVRIDPQLEELESPFLAQNAEVVAYLEAYRAWWNNPETPLGDEAHLGVMLDQCQEVLQRVRRRATRRGTSLTLTFTLERLRQHLERVHQLLGLLRELHQTRTPTALLPQAVALFKQTVHAECRRNRLSDYWSTNVSLLSLRMTESASKRGEKYITTSRREYLSMLLSAAIGGIIIAFMSAFKIVLREKQLAPLTEALCFCLNYGIGFALIHILGGTVATKQPAMTANAIAASIGESRGKTRDLENLATVIVCTLRSQLAAIIGNLGLSIPVAILFSLAFLHYTGVPFIDTINADHLFADVHPLSGALFFAAVAGVCLFLSGLIAAYYDNLTAYNRIPERLAQLRWPRRLFGEALAKRFTAYIENNLGALAGNFFFGFLLGGASALGVLFGLPLDIRHIAFSAAFVGYAVTAYDFAVPASLIGITAAGILLIGITNLLVSFSLALYVAMRSRSITFAQGRTLSALMLRRFFTHPLEFFLPPRSTETSAPPPPEDNAAHPGNGSNGGNNGNGSSA